MLPMIKKECLLFEMEAKSKEEVLKRMADTLEKEGYLCDKAAFYRDVLEREKEFPTYLDYETGLPHGKSDGVSEAGICIARLKHSVQWTEEEESPVGLVLMIAVRKENDNNLHLQILSKLSRLLMHENFRNQIRQGGRDEVFNLLTEKLTA